MAFSTQCDACGDPTKGINRKNYGHLGSFSLQVDVLY
jgi:hypothetical protein